MTSTTTRRTSCALLAGSAALALLLGGTGVAQAKGVEVRSAGTCSLSSDWKLKAKAEDGGRIGVEFEVDSHVVGQTWTVRLRDNGVGILSGTRTTVAPSGSFTARVLAPNRAGSDTIVGVATNAATGEVCRGSVVYPG